MVAAPFSIHPGTTRRRTRDAVRWKMLHPLEIHTITFPSGEAVPAFTIPQLQPRGSPEALRNMRVRNTTNTATVV